MLYYRYRKGKEPQPSTAGKSLERKRDGRHDRQATAGTAQGNPDHPEGEQNPGRGDHESGRANQRSEEVKRGPA